jgi:histidine triad (HIT) family protein
MESCIFCRIAKKEIPAQILYEGDGVLAFPDIQPQAPTHILIIPKRHYRQLGEIKPEEMSVLQEMFEAARLLAVKAGVQERGYRLAINVNPEGGQSVFHVHMHLLGGRQMGPSLIG